MPKVVVCVDGSQDSDGALAKAIKLLGARKLVVLHVVEQATTSLLDPFHDKLDHIQNLHARENGRKIEEKYRYMCESAGLSNYEIVVEESSSARDHILEKVKALGDVDLIITGSRGLGAISEMLLGSVSTYLTHYSSVPVMVARNEA